MTSPNARRWVTALSVIVGAAVLGAGCVVAGAAYLVSSFFRMDEDPAEVRAERHLMEQVIDDLGFVEPKSTTTEPVTCGGSQGPYVCGHEGVAVFRPEDSDGEALLAHLEDHGWVRMGDAGPSGRLPGVEEPEPVLRRTIDRRNICLTILFRYGRMEVRTTAPSECDAPDEEEGLLWEGWGLYVPDPVPGGFETRGRIVDRAGADRLSPDADGQVTLFLRATSGTTPGHVVELRQTRRSDPGPSPVCPAPDGLTPSPPGLPQPWDAPPLTCRTTPAGRALYVGWDGGPDERAGPLVRRWWFVVLDETVVEIERIEEGPTVAVDGDAELDRFVDSLRPVTYEELVDRYPGDDEAIADVARYDERPPR
jgi:hypothetical protein